MTVTALIGSGMGGSLGIGTESPTAYGTAVAPTSWTEFDGGETLELKPHRTTGTGIRNGAQVASAFQRATTTRTVEGGLVTPVYSKGMGQWLGLIFGTLGITPTRVGTTAAYVQTHPLTPKSNQSATVQVGRPSNDLNLNPYTYTGCKVTKAVFDAKVDEPVRITLTIDGQDVSETIAYTLPVYQGANAGLFWHQGNFQMGVLGSEAPVSGVRAFSLTIESSMNVKKYYLDGSGRKGQPTQNDNVAITGTIDTDFLAKADFADRFYTDAATSIILPFTGALIAGSSTFGLTLQLPRLHFDSEPPKIAGPEILQPSMAFTVLDDGVHVPVTAVYTSTDATL